MENQFNPEKRKYTAEEIDEAIFYAPERTRTMIKNYLCRDHEIKQIDWSQGRMFINTHTSSHIDCGPVEL